MITTQHNHEVESLILGSLISGNTNLIDNLKEEYFTTELNKNIFNAVYKLYDKNKPIDLVTVDELLGGNHFQYFSDLSEHGLLGHQKEHINILVNQYKRNETNKIIIESVTEIKTTKNVDVFNAELTTKLDNIMLVDESTYLDDVESIADEVMSYLKSGVIDAHDKYRTGIQFIDDNMVALLPKELTIIGAKSGVGKTALALQMFKRTCFNANPLFITREMDKTQIFCRMLASELKIDSRKFRRKSFTKEEWNRIEKSLPILKSQMQARINDKVSTISGIKKQLRKNKSDILFVDYIQLLDSDKNYGSREREVAAISRDLKNITLDFGIPVVALTQLNDNLGDLRPTGERVMRESKAIYHDANNVIYVHEPSNEQVKSIIENPRFAEYRKSLHDIEDTEGHTVREIIIDKQRDGSKASKFFRYIGPYLTFENISKVY